MNYTIKLGVKSLKEIKLFINYADEFYFSVQNIPSQKSYCSISFDESCEVISYLIENKKSPLLLLNGTQYSNEDYKNILKYVEGYKKIGLSDLVIGDPNLAMMFSSLNFDIKLHLSTMIQVFNVETLHFWKKYGVQRFMIPNNIMNSELKILIKESGIESELFFPSMACPMVINNCLFRVKYDENKCNPQSSEDDFLKLKKEYHCSKLYCNHNQGYIKKYDPREFTYAHIFQCLQNGVRILKLNTRNRSLNEIKSRILHAKLIMKVFEQENTNEERFLEIIKNSPFHNPEFLCKK